MIVFILLLILGLAGAILLAAGSRSQSGSVFLGGLAALLVSVIGIGALCYNQVPTRNVGIVTSFGKPTGATADPGVEWTKPWEDIDDWDASRNTFDRLGDRCLWVSVSGGKACIPVQIEWSAKEENAPAEWAAYKEVDGIEGGRFGTFTARRVNPQMDAAITTTFTSFNPLGTVDKVSGGVKAPDLNAEYKDALKRNLEAAVGDSVRIETIAFGTPQYDEPTTNAISAFGQKVLEKRNLAVDKENAATRKAITEQNATVPAVTRCLEIAEKLGKEPGLCMTPATATRPIGQ